MWSLRPSTSLSAEFEILIARWMQRKGGWIFGSAAPLGRNSAWRTGTANSGFETEEDDIAGSDRMGQGQRLLRGDRLKRAEAIWGLPRLMAIGGTAELGRRVPECYESTLTGNKSVAGANQVVRRIVIAPPKHRGQGS